MDINTVASQKQILLQKRKVKLRKQLFVASILVLPIINFLVLWLYVNIDALALAFQKEDYSTGSLKLLFTMDNFKLVYEGFFETEGLYRAFVNTLLFYFNSLLVITPIGLLLSYFIFKKIFLYRSFRFIIYLPSIIMGSALVLLFKSTIMAGGPYEAILRAMGKEYVNPLSGDELMPFLLLYQLTFGFGGSLIIWGGAMNSIDIEVLEAGYIDGCNWLQELVFLIIPMIWPTLSTTLILGFAGILGASGPVLAFTQGAGNTETLSYILYCYATGMGGKAQDIYYASALGMCMTVITLPLVIFLRKALNKIQGD